MDWRHTYLSSKVWKVIFKRWTMWAREAVVMVFANIAPMKLPPLVVTESGKHSPITSACQCVGWLSTGHAAIRWCGEVHGPWPIPILAHFYIKATWQTLLSDGISSLSANSGFCGKSHACCGPQGNWSASFCLSVLGGSFSWSRTTAVISLPLVCHTQLCSRD